MTFANLLEAIGEFLQAAIDAKFETEKIKKVVYDYPDLLTHTENRLLFLHLGDVNYESLTTTNDVARIRVVVYGVVGGKDPASLQADMCAFADSLYDVVQQNKSLGGNCDVAFVRSIQFYQDVEGVQNRKAFEAQLECLIET